MGGKGKRERKEGWRKGGRGRREEGRGWKGIGGVVVLDINIIRSRTLPGVIGEGRKKICVYVREKKKKENRERGREGCKEMEKKNKEENYPCVRSQRGGGEKRRKRKEEEEKQEEEKQEKKGKK